MTPFEFNLHGRGRADEMRDQVELARSIAWATAALSRAKTIPTYERWMGRGSDAARPLVGKEAEERTAEHLAAVAAVTEARAKRDQ